MNAMSSVFVHPQADGPVQQSFISSMFAALGPFYGPVLPLVGCVIFIGACLVVALNRRPAVIAAYLVF